MLNFVSFGTLTVNLSSGATKTCENIRIGQGHNYFGLPPGLPQNNWWIASRGCHATNATSPLGSYYHLACESCGVCLGYGPLKSNKVFIKELGEPNCEDGD